MGYAVSDILGPLQILDRISQLDLPGTSLQRIFGWNIASFATPVLEENDNGSIDDCPLRTGQYDIFDITRKVATARVPGTAASKQKPQRVGAVQFTLPRSAEQIELLHEDMQNRRGIGTQVSDLTRNVESYIEAQTEYMAQRFANLIEFQAACVLRGSYSFSQDGDDLQHCFSGGQVTVDYQVPASNLGSLDMLGDGPILAASWATDSTDIPDHITKIHHAFLEQTGMGLSRMIMGMEVWNYLLNNDFIRNFAGIAASPFELIERKSAGEFVARLHAFPWITIHIVDYGLEVFNPSSGEFEYERLIEEDHVAFIPEPNKRWIKYNRGGEHVTEGPNGATSFQYGFYPFAYPTHNPSGWMLNAVFNGLPALLRPRALAYGDVTG